LGENNFSISARDNSSLFYGGKLDGDGELIDINIVLFDSLIHSIVLFFDG